MVYHNLALIFGVYNCVIPINANPVSRRRRGGLQVCVVEHSVFIQKFVRNSRNSLGKYGGSERSNAVQPKKIPANTNTL